jgi:hypothetical protein
MQTVEVGQDRAGMMAGVAAEGGSELEVAESVAACLVVRHIHRAAAAAASGQMPMKIVC